MPLKKMTMGQLLVEESLPKEMQGQHRVLDKKGINALLRELAEKHPDKYAEVSKKLSDVGRTVATEFGGYSFGLQHLKKSEVAKKNQIEMRTKMAQVLNRDDLSPEQRNDLIVKMVGGYQQKQIDQIYDESVKANNPLALQVVSGSRGNKMNLGSLLGSDMLYSDHRDRVIPLPVMRSYSEGLSPIEYWASTYGARRGTMATKFATQDAGFLSKQLNQVAHRLMVVDEDDDGRFENRGLPVDTDDADNEGALLAQDVGPYKRNTVITPKISKHLKGLGHDRLLVRSPLVGGSPDGGVYARDVGVRERGTLPGRGEQVGLTAAQALSEPLSQGQLSAKHSGGVAGQEKAVGGFAYINQLIQVPKKFKGGAAHAEADGRVTDIQEAPAGGSFVFVGEQKHYVPAGVELKVKKGDEIEAGDVLSEGFPNPAIVTEHKGVGEGKRYFVNAFRQAMTDAGMKCNRRNVELLARGLINHVKLTDEVGDHVPDDVVPYSTMEHLYQPREGHQIVTPDRAAGQYLERPVLHYSIGTKVRPSVLKELQHFGVKDVAVHAEPPPFQANMVRGMYSLQNDPDWMTRMYGSGLKGSLLDATHRGAVSDEEGTSFVPGLARAQEFGRVGTVRQPERGGPLPPEGQPFGEVARPNLQKPTPTPTASDMPVTPGQAPKPKKQGMFSGLFKLSNDERAAACLRVRGLTKKAEQPKVTSTVTPNTGSSTVTAGGTPKPVAPPPQPPPPVAPATPALPSAPGQPAQPATPVVPGNAGGVPGAAPAPPTVHNTPAPAGQVHPDRMMPKDPWMAGGNKSFEGQNPNAFNEGYTPGNGMMGPDDSPDIMKSFIQGGGQKDDGSDGFGGSFGAVTRFGSLMDTRAVATLTQGQNRLPSEGGEYRDDLIGGNPRAVDPSIMGGLSHAPAAGQPAAGQTAEVPTTNGPAPKPIGALDLLKSVAGPEAALTAGGLSVAYRGVRNFLGVPAKGGLLGGLMKPLSRFAAPLGFGVEAYEGMSMSDADARRRFDDKLAGKVDTVLPFGLGTVKGDSLGGYLFNNAMEPGKNLAAAGAGANMASSEHADARYDRRVVDAKQALLFEKVLSDPNATPQRKADAQKRLDEIRGQHAPDLVDRTAGRVLGTLGVGVKPDAFEATKKWEEEKAVMKRKKDAEAQALAGRQQSLQGIAAKIHAGQPVSEDERRAVSDWRIAQGTTYAPLDDATRATFDLHDVLPQIQQRVAAGQKYNFADDRVDLAALAKAAKRIPGSYGQEALRTLQAATALHDPNLISKPAPGQPVSVEATHAWQKRLAGVKGMKAVEQIRRERDNLMAIAQANPNNAELLDSVEEQLYQMSDFVTGSKTNGAYNFAGDEELKGLNATGKFDPKAWIKEFDEARTRVRPPAVPPAVKTGFDLAPFAGMPRLGGFAGLTV